MGKKGFTLVELLVVIVILGLIMIVVATTAFPAMNKAKMNSLETYAMRLVEKAKERCIADSCTDGTKYTVEELMGENAEKGYKGSLVISDVGKDYKVSGGVISNDENFVASIVNDKLELASQVSFEEDSWATIATIVRLGNTNSYKVGEEKKVEIDGLSYKVRVSNTSTPKECSKDSYSQSACGFVVEFVDIITKSKLNLPITYNGTYYQYGTNINGWPSSYMNKFLNDTTDSTITSIYESLPVELRNVIVETKVVSGRGIKDANNFISYDKLYLLSTKELYGINGSLSLFDTAKEETRQLDYYEQNGVTTSNYKLAIKNYQGAALQWYLRTAASNGDQSFYSASTTGAPSTITPANTRGVSPAFRIG